MDEVDSDADVESELTLKSTMAKIFKASERQQDVSEEDVDSNAADGVTIEATLEAVEVRSSRSS